MKLYNALNRLSLSLPGGKASLDTTKGKKKPLIFHQLARTGGGGLGGYRWQQIGGWWWPHRENEDGSRVPLGRRSGGGGGGDGGGNGGGGAGEDDDSDDEQDSFADDDVIVWRDDKGLQCIPIVPRLDLPNNPTAIIEMLERVVLDMSNTRVGTKGSRGFRKHFCRTGEVIANDTLVKFNSKKMSRRALIIINQLHAALIKNRGTMHRGIFYTAADMFSKENHHADIDKILKQLAVGLDVPVRAFGVLSETKTKYDGQLKFIYNRGKADESVFDIEDTNNQIHNETGFTPNRRVQLNMDGIQPLDPLNRTVHMESSAKVVFVVEDGQMFNLVKSDKMWKDKSVSVLDQDGRPVLDNDNQPRTRIVRGVPMILVCSHGRPDGVGREFVAHLKSKFEVPVVY